MSQNWSAHENPRPKDDWKHRKSRDVAPGSPIYLSDGTNYVPLRQLPQRVTEALYEAVEKFIRLGCAEKPYGFPAVAGRRQHPTLRGV